MALCSESTGSSVAPPALDLGQHERAGADQAFLVGEADDGASRGGRERRPEPCCADDPGHDEIGRRRRGLDQGLASRPGNGLRAASASLSAPWSAGSPMTACFAPTARACSASCSTLRWAVSASTSKAAGWRAIRSMVLQPIEPVEPRMVTRLGAAPSPAAWICGSGETSTAASIGAIHEVPSSAGVLA